MTDVAENEAVEALQRLGFSKYEAQVFIALERLGSGTARDVGRMTDVPRSQVYGAAENLEERGLIEVQQSNPIQYRAVTLDEAREILQERFECEQDRAFEFLERAREGSDHKDEHQEGVWTVHGQGNVSTRARQLVDDAESHVLYVTNGDLIDDDVVQTLDERGEDFDVWVFYVDETGADAFSNASNVSLVPFPEEKDEMTGRLLAIDGDTILLSVLGGEELPGVRKETAIWSSDTGFATVLLQLVGSHLGEEVGTKL